MSDKITKFEVGKKYTTKYKTAPRTCLVVAKDYVLFSAQDDIPHSRPLTVDPHWWNEWEEYKFPVVLKWLVVKNITAYPC